MTKCENCRGCGQENSMTACSPCQGLGYVETPKQDVAKED